MTPFAAMPPARPSREPPYRADSAPPSPSPPRFRDSRAPWMRRRRARSALFSHGRVKMVLVGLGCVVMGWLLTATLGPAPYHIASGGVPGPPAGGSAAAGAVDARPGIIGEVDPDEEAGAGAGDGPGAGPKPPSITGALAELHGAVKDKLQAWNPYGPKSRPGAAGHRSAAAAPTGVNATAPAVGGEEVRDGLAEAEQLGARTRIGKCTILFHGNSYWERAIRTHERHDREHGYRLHVLRQELMDDVWSKPAYILSVLLRELGKPASERLDWLFWIDADTVLLNPHIPLDVFLPPPGAEFEHVHLVFSNDWNGLNNGVFPVRVNQWAVNLFAAIVAWRHYRPDEPLVFRDQSAMDALMHDPAFAPHVVQAPQRWFNAYQGEHNETLAPFQIRRGDLLVHFAGVPDREARMNYWLERAEQHLDDWEVPLKSTSYPREAKDFWAEQRQLRQQQRETLARARGRAKELLATVEQKLADYGDRLDPGQKDAIDSHRHDLAALLLLPDSAPTADLDHIHAATQSLDSLTAPLDAALREASQKLLKAAHAAILAGEKDLLDHGLADGNPPPDAPLPPFLAPLTRVADAVATLKDLVMRPQEQWDRHTISSATDRVTDARARLHDELQAAQRQTEQEQEQAEADATRKQEEADADADATREPAEAEIGAGEATASPSGDPNARRAPLGKTWG